MQDASHCHSAPLHLIQQVQSHGAMLVVADNGSIVAASANAPLFLGCSSTVFLGANCGLVLPELRAVLAAPDQGGQPGRNTRLWKVAVNRRLFTVASHRNGALRFLEFEHASEQSKFALQGSRDALFERFLGELEETLSARAAATILLRHIAAIVGFDRAMLIQRRHNGHYQVIAEVCKSSVPSYLQHHFPATDIPPNAQRMYLVKRQRYIANAWREPVPLLALEQEPIDLTGAELRAVHPVHIQYMRTMGTASSFSVSIVVNKVLWGMVVCHNRDPAPLSFHERQSCLHTANIVGLHMTSLIIRRETARRHRQEKHLARLRQYLFSQSFDTSEVKLFLHSMLRVFRADGALLHHNHALYRFGRTPHDHDSKQLIQWLQNNQTGTVFAAETVIAALADHAGIVSNASGVLSVKFGDGSLLVLVRREFQEAVRWAGQPQHLNLSDTGLGPRASFQTWLHLTRGQAQPWVELDTQAAGDVARMLNELLALRQAERRSYTDTLTGLWNRSWMESKANSLMYDPSGGRRFFALLLLDLDQFKPVNDSLGHDAGDQVLIDVALRLRQSVRDSDHIVRLGGDEFVVLLEGVNTAARAMELAERALDRLREPFVAKEELVRVHASIGIVLHPLHGNDIQQLMGKADQAMYEVKKTGRNGCRVYS